MALADKRISRIANDIEQYSKNSAEQAVAEQPDDHASWTKESDAGEREHHEDDIGSRFYH